MTTVTIGNDTHRKLEKLKEEKGASSFDQLLNDLAEKELKVPDSLFGVAEGLNDGEIRDRNDRMDRE